MENEFLDLPDNPEEAFAVLQKRRSRYLNDEFDNYNQRREHDRHYVDTLIAFDEVHHLKIFSDLKTPPNGDNQFDDFFQSFRRHAEITSQKIRIEIARRLKTGTCNIVILDSSSRSAIHALIEKIREKLNELKLPEAKRNNLFNKLNSFVSEIDRNQTRTEAYLAFAVSLFKTARECSTEFQPILDTNDRILDQLERAKKLQDSLPSWEDHLKIEPPKKQLPKPNTNSDDDVPF
jgi:GGDEF domain-containing protein